MKIQHIKYIWDTAKTVLIRKPVAVNACFKKKKITKQCLKEAGKENTVKFKVSKIKEINMTRGK